MTTIPHSVTSSSTSSSPLQNVTPSRLGSALPLPKFRVYIETESTARASLVSASENNKRLIFPQHVRHFGFPLMVGECIVGSA